MKKVLIIIGGLAILAFGYWTISPLFITQEVHDELNENDASLSSEAFPIQDTPAHPARGSIRIIETPDETIVRLENYDGTNGPDLRLYLATDTDASSFVDLGPTKGNKGDIHYVVPDDVDIDEYAYVLTWCRAFGVLFDYALIN